jgi:hypothetical protein
MKNNPLANSWIKGLEGRLNRKLAADEENRVITLASMVRELQTDPNAPPTSIRRSKNAKSRKEQYEESRRLRGLDPGLPE